MIPTSAEYSTAISANHRQSYAKVLIHFSDTVSLEFTDHDIFSITLHESKYTNSAQLPCGNICSHQIEVKLLNRDRLFDPENIASPLYNLVKANCKIEPFIGIELSDSSIEWIPLGIFWSGEWTIPENELWVTTTGVDRLELLHRSLYQTGQVVTPPAAIMHEADTAAEWMQGVLYCLTTDFLNLKLDISGA